MSKYNLSVREIFGLERTQGEVGIEVELEGKNVLMDHIRPLWNYHADGSLRGESAEFVLAKPIARGKVPEALNALFGTLKKHGTKIRQDSPNTSVHIHLNVQEWSLKKVYNLITCWYIFEKMLVKWCGEEREGNLFCLRGQDAEAILQRYASAVRYSRYNTIVDADGLRYAAFNPTSMAKFGSVEFRSLAGVYDEDIIRTWTEILLELKDFAEKFDCPPDIIIEMSRCGSDEFLRMVFPKHWHTLTQGDYKTYMKEGMRLIQGVAYAVNWERGELTDVKKKVLLDEHQQRGEDPDEVMPNGDDDDAARRDWERPRPGEGMQQWQDRLAGGRPIVAEPRLNRWGGGAPPMPRMRLNDIMARPVEPEAVPDGPPRLAPEEMGALRRHIDLIARGGGNGNNHDVVIHDEVEPIAPRRVHLRAGEVVQKWQDLQGRLVEIFINDEGDRQMRVND